MPQHCREAVPHEASGVLTAPLRMSCHSPPLPAHMRDVPLLLKDLCIAPACKVQLRCCRARGFSVGVADSRGGPARARGDQRGHGLAHAAPSAGACAGPGRLRGIFRSALSPALPHAWGVCHASRMPCWVVQQTVQCCAAPRRTEAPSGKECAGELTACESREVHIGSVAPCKCPCAEAACTCPKIHLLARLQRFQPGFCRSGRHIAGNESVPNISVLPARMKSCGETWGRTSMLHACGCVGQ